MFLWFHRRPSRLCFIFILNSSTVNLISILILLFNWFFSLFFINRFCNKYWFFLLFLPFVLSKIIIFEVLLYNHNLDKLNFLWFSLLRNLRNIFSLFIGAFSWLSLILWLVLIFIVVGRFHWLIYFWYWLSIYWVGSILVLDHLVFEVVSKSNICILLFYAKAYLLVSRKITQNLSWLRINKLVVRIISMSLRSQLTTRSMSSLKFNRIRKCGWINWNWHIIWIFLSMHLTIEIIKRIFFFTDFIER